MHKRTENENILLRQGALPSHVWRACSSSKDLYCSKQLLQWREQALKGQKPTPFQLVQKQTQPNFRMSLSVPWCKCFRVREREAVNGSHFFSSDPQRVSHS